MVSEGSHAQVDIKLQICSKNYGYHTFFCRFAGQICRFADKICRFADKFADLQTNLQQAVFQKVIIGFNI